MHNNILNFTQHGTPYYDLYKLITDYAIDVDIVEDENEIIYLPDILTLQEAMIDEIVHDVLNTKKNIFMLKKVNPILLSFKYVFAKAMESSIVALKYGVEAVDLGYKYDDLLKDRCGIALDEEWSSIISLEVNRYIDGIFNKFSEYISNCSNVIKPGDFSLSQTMAIGLRAINVVGISLVVKIKQQREEFMIHPSRKKTLRKE